MICGNKEKCNEIKEWIKNQLKLNQKNISFNNLIFVCGKSGIGKTYNIKHICNELDLHVVYLTSSNCSSSGELQDIMVKNLTSSMFQLLTNNQQQKIIVIDEIETIMSLDRSINTTLYNILNDGKYKKTPIICISSIENLKKMGNIKKKCKIFELCEPNYDDIYNLMINLYPNNDKNIIENIIKNTGNNIEQCIQKVENNTCFSNMDDTLNLLSLYDVNFNRELLHKIILTDSLLIPLKYHENLIIELKNRRCTISQRHDYYKKFLDVFMDYDKILCHNYEDISTSLFVTMIYPLTKLQIKNNKISNIDKFTKVLSYQSLQKKNIKKSYSSVFPLHQISNYHINMIGRKYIFIK